ncbi:MAG: hypothetical protein NZ659_07745 [Acidimicrobiales bacterium]|nr:hypothetical protein [Acidimicrobiales bacterium]
MGKPQSNDPDPGGGIVAVPSAITIHMDIEVAAGNSAYKYEKTSFGRESPLKSHPKVAWSDQADKGYAAPTGAAHKSMNQYVSDLSERSVKTATNYTPGPMDAQIVTPEQAGKMYEGMGVEQKSDAIRTDMTSILYNGDAITVDTLREARIAAGTLKADGTEDEDPDNPGEKKKLYIFDPMYINVETGFERNTSSVYEHQPHAAFAALSGERTETTYEEQQNTPFSGEKKEVRHYSPFTIALLPPKEVTDLNTGATAKKDPYSWSGLGTLTDKINEDIMVTPKENTGYFSSAVDGDGARLAKRSKSAMKLDQAISEMSMLVHEGQVSNVVDETIQGDSYTGFNSTPLISIANVADIYMQLLQMFRTPPLLLLVNPTSMNVTYSKIQAHQERTRYGYVFQAWGEQLPVINFAGRIGAFYGGESPGGRRQFMSLEETTHVSGIQEAARKVSPAFQNLMNLMKLYKNNGYIRDNVSGSQANHLIGMVEISYDGTRYIGHFDKLEYTFEETNNLGGINFSFDFTATEIRKNADERQAYVMKMSNPNQGGRFGDGSADQTFSSMDQFYDTMDRTGQSGWDLQTSNTLPEAAESWKQQTAFPTKDNPEYGWGQQGIQVNAGQDNAGRVDDDDLAVGNLDVEDFE